MDGYYDNPLGSPCFLLAKVSHLMRHADPQDRRAYWIGLTPAITPVHADTLRRLNTQRIAALRAVYDNRASHCH